MLSANRFMWIAIGIASVQAFNVILFLQQQQIINSL